MGNYFRKIIDLLDALQTINAIFYSSIILIRLIVQAGAIHLVGGGQYCGRLNFTTMGTGAQCLIITGQSTKPKWFVVSSAFLVQLRLHTVRGHVQSGQIMPTAKEERQLYLIAEARIGESKTVIMERMLVWCVTSGWAFQTVLLD